MVKITGIYQGEKHCELTHVDSKAKIQTDAPKDNNGRGESFSPTDLVGAAVGSCMLTVMAMWAERHSMSLVGSHVSVVKDMTAQPRRIASLTVDVHMPTAIPADQRKLLEDIAHTCPVKRSLHPDVQVPVRFVYDV